MNLKAYSFYLILLIFLLNGSDLYSQQSAVQISSERNSRDGYTFYAQNNSQTPFVVTIDFTRLINLTSSGSLPYSANATRGRSRLLTLNQSMTEQQTSFRYRYRYQSGCLNTEPDRDIEYLLPYPEGTAAKGGQLSYIGRWIEQETPEGWYSLVFYIEEPTTIHAARKGTVVAVRDGDNTPNSELVFSTNRNFVTIVHDDCTFSRYSTFRDDEIYVNEGDIVYPGDELGMASGDELGFGNQIRLLTYYRNDASISIERSESEGIHSWHYVKPLFRTASAEKVEIERDTEYISLHPAEVITSEMGRREQRRRSRSN
jgi:hypothetical protein